MPVQNKQKGSREAKTNEKNQVFTMPLQNKQKGSTREQKNKCMGKVVFGL